MPFRQNIVFLSILPKIIVKNLTTKHTKNTKGNLKERLVSLYLALPLQGLLCGTLLFPGFHPGLLAVSPFGHFFTPPLKRVKTTCRLQPKYIGRRKIFYE
jgi:hypothetical protein